MKIEFNRKNIERLTEEFASEEKFMTIILPRLLILINIKRELKSFSNLHWEFEYNSFNTENNKITITYPTSNPNFNFYYEIPLRLSFELRLFLANSSVHFIDIYNFLLKNNMITKENYTLEAQYRKLPHLTINKNIKRYNISILKSIVGEESSIDDKISECVKACIEKYNTTLKNILLNFQQ